MTGKLSKILKASFLLLCVSWYSRLLSAVSIVILARNLTQQDFGILAGCFIVQGFFNVLSNVGSGPYLIRKATITDDDINAAWTINFLSRLMMAVLIFAISEPAASYMRIPEMALVLKVMSLSAIFIGLQNPAINLKIKELDYSKLSVLEVVTKSISSTASVVIAVLFHTYWAVVIAGLLYNGLYALGSQFIVRKKLKFVLHDIGLQWQFSKWVLLKGIINYVKVAFDKVIVGKFYSVSELGLYNFANEASTTAMQFIISPLSSVIYPSLSSYVDDPKSLLDKVYKSMVILGCVYVPVVFGGVYLADLIVPEVFGSQWINAIPLFEAFLIMSFAGLFGGILTDVFTLTGEVKRQFFYELMTSVLFLLLILGISSLSLVQFAQYRSCIAYLMLVLLVRALHKVIAISLTRMALLMLPFIASALVMIGVVGLCEQMLVTEIALLNLAMYILIGAAVYGVMSMILIAIAQRFSNEYAFLFKTFVNPLLQRVKRRSQLLGGR